MLLRSLLDGLKCIGIRAGARALNLTQKSVGRWLRRRQEAKEECMKHAASLLVLLLMALSGGSALAQGAPPPQAKGEFKNAAGEAIGNVTLTQMPDGTVVVSAEVKGMPPGDHGFHIHAVGS